MCPICPKRVVPESLDYRRGRSHCASAGGRSGNAGYPVAGALASQDYSLEAIFLWSYIGVRPWEVRFDREFEKEFARLDEDVQDELISHAGVIEEHGPALGRPIVDTLRDSSYPNMKELRFGPAQGVWRVAFIFDSKSRGVLLVAGNKVGLWGRDEEAFYADLIEVADSRYAAYLRKSRKTNTPKDGLRDR